MSVGEEQSHVEVDEVLEDRDEGAVSSVSMN